MIKFLKKLNAFLEKMKSDEPLYDPLKGYSFRMLSVSNDAEQKKEVQKFQSEFESKKKKCEVLIVNVTSDPDKWTIAGFNDEEKFKELLIDDPGSELSIELKTVPTNERKIVELVISNLNRTPLKWPIWRWDQLRRLGESRAVRLASLLPVLSFILSSAESFQAHLSITIVSFNVLLFFYGLLCFSIGTLVYVLFVPYQVSRYADDVEYYNEEKDAWWNKEEDALFHRIDQAWINKRDWTNEGLYIKSIFTTTGRADISPEERILFIRYYYKYLAEKFPRLRFVVSSFYLLGFVLTSIPFLLRILDLTFSVLFNK